MKTITIHVPEETYRVYQEHAAKTNQSASSLIRDAMEEYYDKHMSARGSVFDAEPVSLGEARKSLSRDDDLLEAMLP